MMTPKQMKAYVAKLTRERRAQEAQRASSPFAGLGIGRPPGESGPAADVELTDDNWMRDARDPKKTEEG
jgi:hypothetical protein